MACDVTPFFRSESYESCLAASVSWQEDCEHHDDVTPFFRSESYESCLAASVSWQEDCEHHDEKEKTAFA